GGRRRGARPRPAAGRRGTAGGLKCSSWKPATTGIRVAPARRSATSLTARRTHRRAAARALRNRRAVQGNEGRRAGDPEGLREDARGLRSPVYFRFILTVDNAAAERFRRLDGLFCERVLRDAV